MVAFYQHEITNWMDGTENLSDGEYRAYHVICQMIYLHDGPITFNERGLAAQCKQHILSFRRNFAKLLERKKLTLDGGKVSNPKATKVLAKIKEARRPRKAKAPEKQPAAAEAAQTLPLTGGESRGYRLSKPLKNQRAGAVENSREVSTKEPNGSLALSSGSSPVDLEKDLFVRGKAVLGSNAGGMIANLLRAKHGSVELARAVIEQAATKQSPREYVGAAIRAVPGQGTKGGNAFARIAAQSAFDEMEASRDFGLR